MPVETRTVDKGNSLLFIANLFEHIAVQFPKKHFKI